MAMIKRNRNTPFVAYDLLGGYISLVFNAMDWIVSFWIGKPPYIIGGIRKPSEFFGIFNLWIGDRLVFDSQDRGYRNISERFPTVPVEYVGWIYGNIEDERILRELGVTGKMIWKASDNSNRVQPTADEKSGIFEYCTITMEVAKKLRDNYFAFPPQTFTGIDKDGNQTIHQPLWKGIYED